jgi:hypothetical protein
MKKITKKEKFEMLKAIPAVQENGMLIEFINHEIELLAKKGAGGEKKMTATQKVNEGVKTTIMESMAPGQLYSISDMIKQFDCCAGMSNQRVNALVRQMMPEKVERVEVKRRAYFVLAGTYEGEVEGE